MPRSPRPFQPAACLVAFLLALITCASAACAQDNVSKPQAREPIKGSVELDKTVPEVPDQYKPGAAFSQADFQGMTPNNVWFPVPNWFAGKWHGETKTISYVADCKSGLGQNVHLELPQRNDVIHGHQRDKSGQIWEFIGIPRIQKCEVANGFAYLNVIREDVLQTDSSAVVLKVLNNQTTVDSTKLVIKDSNQVQQIGTYTPMEDDLMKLDAALKNFDADGYPIQMQLMSTLMKRTSPFGNVDSIDGLDLKKLFIEYLKASGHQDVLPN